MESLKTSSRNLSVVIKTELQLQFLGFCSCQLNNFINKAPIYKIFGLSLDDTPTKDLWTKDEVCGQDVQYVSSVLFAVWMFAKFGGYNFCRSMTMARCC